MINFNLIAAQRALCAKTELRPLRHDLLRCNLRFFSDIYMQFRGRLKKYVQGHSIFIEGIKGRDSRRQVHKYPRGSWEILYLLSIFNNLKISTRNYGCRTGPGFMPLENISKLSFSWPCHLLYNFSLSKPTGRPFFAGMSLFSTQIYVFESIRRVFYF